MPASRAVLAAFLALLIVFPAAASAKARAAKAPAPAASSSASSDFNRAVRFGFTGDYDRAIAAYETFLEANPKDRLSPVAAMAAANLQLEGRHDTTAAEQAFDRVLTNFPESAYAPEAAFHKGECADARGDAAGAAAAYDEALRRADARGADLDEGWIGRALEASVRAHTKAGEPAKAIEACERIAVSSKSPEIAAAARFRIGEGYESLGENAKAAASYRAVIENYPASAPFEPALAKRPLIEKHETLDWTPYVLYSRGTRILRRDYAGALALTDSALAAQPAPALRECAEYRKISLEAAIAGDYTEGCRRLREFIAAHPGGPRTAYAQNVLEENWQPIADLEAAARETPDDIGTLSALGQMYAQVRSAPRAIEVLEKARSLAPDDDTVQLMLGYMYTTAGRPQEALKAFEFYLQRNPDDADVLNLIGYGQLSAGQPEQAVGYFERFVALSPNDPNAHDSLGEGLLGAGRLEDAAREYEKAVALDPNFTNSHFMLGRVYGQLGDKVRSAGAYKRFLELVSEGPQADEARAALSEIEGSAPKESRP